MTTARSSLETRCASDRPPLLSSATWRPKVIQDGSSFPVYKQGESLKLHYLGKCALQDTSSRIPIFPFGRQLFHKRLQTFIHTKSIEGQPKPFCFDSTAEFSSSADKHQGCRPERYSLQIALFQAAGIFTKILQLYSNCGLNENQNDMQTAPRCRMAFFTAHSSPVKPSYHVFWKLY